MARKQTSIHGLVKELVSQTDETKVRERLLQMRWDKGVADDQYVQVFTLVTLARLGNGYAHNRGLANSDNGHDSNPIAAVASWLEQRDMTFRQFDDEALEIGMRLDSCTIQILVMKPTDTMTLLFVAREIMTVPRRAEVAVLKAINKINYECWIGDFVLEPGTNRLQFRFSIPLPGDAVLSDIQIEAAVLVCCKAIDDHYPKLAKVCWGSNR